VLPAVLGKMKNEEVLAYDSQALGQHRASSGNTDPAKSNIFTYYGWKDKPFFLELHFTNFPILQYSTPFN
jgi:hypothetical protein